VQNAPELVSLYSIFRAISVKKHKTQTKSGQVSDVVAHLHRRRYIVIQQVPREIVNTNHSW